MGRCSENMQQIYRRTSMPKCDLLSICCIFPELLFLRTPLESCLCNLEKCKKKPLNIASFRTREKLSLNEKNSKRKSFAKVCSTTNSTLATVFRLSTCALIIHPQLHIIISLFNCFPVYLFPCLANNAFHQY